MLLSLAAIALGLTLLVWSADRFVAGAAATAQHLGMSPLLIGMTIVSLGTSAPEILVSAIAALSGTPGLAVGNALGSNIANVGLVLGVTALIAPLPIQNGLLKKEIPLLLIATLVAGACLANSFLGPWDGLVLVALLVFTLRYLFKNDTPHEGSDESLPIMALGPAFAALWLAVGLIVLIVSSRILVWGAVNVAQALGVSDLVIGLTIIAIGTSLPELAASIAGALKGHHDIVIGNIVGSNIFNQLAVLPIPGLLAPTVLEADVFQRDYLIMLGITGLLCAFLYIMRRKGALNRIEGLLLAALYAGYMLLLYFTAAPPG